MHNSIQMKKTQIPDVFKSQLCSYWVQFYSDGVTQATNMDQFVIQKAVQD